MNATPENAARNRATLIGNIKRDLSLPDDRTAWTVEQRFQFNNTFARFVVSHPTSFTAEDVQISNTFLGQRAASTGGYDPELDDTFFGNTDIGLASVADDLRNAIPKIGGGVLIAAVILGGLFIYFNSAAIKATVKEATTT